MLWSDDCFELGIGSVPCLQDVSQPNQCSDFDRSTSCQANAFSVYQALLDSTLREVTDAYSSVNGQEPSHGMRICFYPQLSRGGFIVRLISLLKSAPPLNFRITFLSESDCSSADFLATGAVFGICSSTSFVAQIDFVSATERTDVDFQLNGLSQCVMILSNSKFTFEDLEITVDAVNTVGGSIPVPSPPSSGGGGGLPEIMTGTSGIAIWSGIALSVLGLIITLISFFSPEWGQTLREFVESIVEILRGGAAFTSRTYEETNQRVQDAKFMFTENVDARKKEARFLQRNASNNAEQIKRQARQNIKEGRNAADGIRQKYDNANSFASDTRNLAVERFQREKQLAAQDIQERKERATYQTQTAISLSERAKVRANVTIEMAERQRQLDAQDMQERKERAK